MDQELITVRAAAEILGRSQKRLYEMIKDGKFDKHTVHGRIHLSLEQVEGYKPPRRGRPLTPGGVSKRTETLKLYFQILGECDHLTWEMVDLIKQVEAQIGWPLSEETVRGLLADYIKHH